jgi:hypothetical protein
LYQNQPHTQIALTLRTTFTSITHPIIVHILSLA